jgi:hypothetical protein
MPQDVTSIPIVSSNGSHVLARPNLGCFSRSNKDFVLYDNQGQALWRKRMERICNFSEFCDGNFSEDNKYVVIQKTLLEIGSKKIVWQLNPDDKETFAGKFDDIICIRKSGEYEVSSGENVSKRYANKVECFSFPNKRLLWQSNFLEIDSIKFVSGRYLLGFNLNEIPETSIYDLKNGKLHGQFPLRFVANIEAAGTDDYLLLAGHDRKNERDREDYKTKILFLDKRGGKIWEKSWAHIVRASSDLKNILIINGARAQFYDNSN